MFYLSFPIVSLWADGVENEEHDVLFLREMLARNIFGARKRSPARAWETIVDSLNEMYSQNSN